MKGYLKKALAMMMAGAMVCGILTGCGSKTTETKAETTAETTAETGAESASGEVSAEVETIEDGVLKVAMRRITGLSRRTKTAPFRFPEAPITLMAMML